MVNFMSGDNSTASCRGLKGREDPLKAYEGVASVRERRLINRSLAFRPKTSSFAKDCFKIPCPEVDPPAVP